MLLPVPCGRCGQPVWPGDAWDLDHPVAYALGGPDELARPAHRSCNRSAGARLARRLRVAVESRDRVW